MATYNYTGANGQDLGSGNTPFFPSLGYLQNVNVSQQGSNTTNSPPSTQKQDKQLFTYSQALFGPNAASFYGLVIPVSVGRRAIVGVPIFASTVYGTAPDNLHVDFAMSLGYGGAPASELIDTQVLRIWANDALVYDATNSSGWNIAAGISFKVYKGTEDQLPDPTLVKWLGAENGIAFRGQLYIMFNNWAVDPLAPSAIPSIRVEVRDTYVAAANILDVTRIDDAAAFDNIGLRFAPDWYRQRVYVVDQPTDSIHTYDMLNMIELYSVPTSVSGFGSAGGFYVDQKYGYLVGGYGVIQNTQPIGSFDPTSGELLSTFGVGSASLVNTSGHFVTANRFTGMTANNIEATDEFVCVVSFFGELGVLKLDPDGALSFVWCGGTGATLNTVNTDFSLLTSPLILACPGDLVSNENAATAFFASKNEIARLVVTPAGAGGYQGRLDIVWEPLSGQEINHMFLTPDKEDLIVFTRGPVLVTGNQYFQRIHIADNLRHKSNPDPGTSGSTPRATTIWQSGPTVRPNENIEPTFGLSQIGGTNTLGYPSVFGPFVILNVQDGGIFMFDFADFAYNGTVASTGSNINTYLNLNQLWNGDGEYMIGFGGAYSTSLMSGGFGPARIYPIVPPADGIPLYTILRWIMQYAGFDTSDLAISNDLSDSFTGSIIEELDLNVWDVLDQMSKAFQFDVFESEGKVKMTRVGRGASLTISFTLDPDNELLSLNASDDEGKGNNDGSGMGNGGQASAYAAFSVERDWNLDAAGTITIRYIDENNEYTVNIARAKKTTFPVRTTDNDNVERLDTPVISSAPIMYAYAAKALYDLYAGITFNNFRLGPKYLRLEPGDVVALSINDMDYTIKVTEGTINEDFSMSIRAQGFANIDTISVSGENSLTLPQVVNGPAISQGYIIDTPPLNPADCAAITDTSLRIYAEVTSYGQAGWIGAALDFADAAAGPYTEMMRDTVTGGSYVGAAASALTGAPGYATDFVSSLVANFAVLPSAITGSTGYLLVGKPGRWEFMSYGAMAVTGATSRKYTFTNLVRGLRGTENHTRDHASGDVVIVWPNTLHMRLLTLDASALDHQFWYKPVGINQQITDVPASTFTEAQNFEKPWAPTSLKAFYASGGSTAINLSWMRRTRLEYDPLGVSGSVQPLEPGWTEQYEIDILSASGAVLRTVTGALTNSYTYASGNVTTDFGTPPVTLSFNVYQISPVVGRGFAGSITTDVLPAP